MFLGCLAELSDRAPLLLGGFCSQVLAVCFLLAVQVSVLLQVDCGFLRSGSRFLGSETRQGSRSASSLRSLGSARSFPLSVARRRALGYLTARDARETGLHLFVVEQRLSRTAQLSGNPRGPK